MNPEPSPLFSLTTSRAGSARITALCGLLFALGTAFAEPAGAKMRAADIPSVDAPAYQALQEGRVNDATALLSSSLATNAADGVAHQLLCRVYYAQNAADEAIHQCELTVSSPGASDAQASDNQLWLGRAYGLKARHAGWFDAFRLARKVQNCFARAAELNPGNVAALNDLGEYDVAAPSIVGGGTDKARGLAASMMPRFPGAAHHLLARIAEAENNPGAAESELKLAIAADKSSETWIDLAMFYQTHSRPDDAVAAIKSGLAVDRTHGAVLVDAATILTRAHREPDLAERCLNNYLSSRAKSDAAPAFKVHLQLSMLLAARGDTQDAHREVAAATALAPGFARNVRPAQGL